MDSHPEEHQEEHKALRAIAHFDPFCNCIIQNVDLGEGKLGAYFL